MPKLAMRFLYGLAQDRHRGRVYESFYCSGRDQDFTHDACIGPVVSGAERIIPAGTTPYSLTKTMTRIL